MLEYPAEGLCRPAENMSLYALQAAMATKELLQSTALAFDNQRRLRFELCGWRGVMPYEECADGAAESHPCRASHLLHHPAYGGGQLR